MNHMERWLAPGILVGIALLQLGLSHFGTLTPWKGGGFGMFASVDSLGMRVVSCEGVTHSGETIRILPFRGINPATVDGWRAMPRNSTLQRLGNELLGMRFVPTGTRQNAATEQFLAENPQLQGQLAPMPQSGAKKTYRPLLPNDPPPSEGEFITLAELRMQWWKIRFDGETKQFTAEPIDEPVQINYPD